MQLKKNEKCPGRIKVVLEDFTKSASLRYMSRLKLRNCEPS